MPPRSGGRANVVPESVSSPGRRTTRKGERPLVQNGRKRLITVLSGCAMIAAVGFMPSSPAQAEPDIDDVQARVDRLYHEAEQASERYNDAKLELTDAHAATSARSRPTRAARTTELEAGRTPGPGLRRAPVRGPEPLRRRPGRRLRRPRGVPLPALDHVGLQRHAGRSSSTTTPPRLEGPRHPPRRHREARRPGRRDARRSWPPRRPPSTRSSPRPRTCSATSRPRSARRSLSRGERAGPRPTSRPPVAPPRPSPTRWPRSARPTSTAPPARAPSTAPA